MVLVQSPRRTLLTSSGGFRVSRLQKGFNRKKFDCGCEVLNRYLREHARAHQEENRSATYVAHEPGSTDVAGFATMSYRTIDRDGGGRPVLLLGRFATDQGFTKQGVGRELLREVFRQTLTLSKTLGCTGVFVDAKTCSRADAYYAKFGFNVVPGMALSDEVVPMFLPIKVVTDALRLAGHS